MTEGREEGGWGAKPTSTTSGGLSVFARYLCDFHIILSLHSTQQQHTSWIYYSFIFLAFIDERICTHPVMLFAGSSSVDNRTGSVVFPVRQTRIECEAGEEEPAYFLSPVSR